MICNDIKKFYAIHPTEFCFLKEVCIRRDIQQSGIYEYVLKIILSKISGSEIKNMSMTFNNAIDIKIGDIENMFGMVIDIEDVSADQWEGISFKISEQENNAFSFFCREFFVEIG